MDFDKRLHPLTMISPLDGRYANHVEQLSQTVSEYALNKARVHVEIEWLISLADNPEISDVTNLSVDEILFLRSISNNFSISDAEKIKSIENVINHDVKSVEYWIREKISALDSLSSKKELIHFSCTSEDINNLADAIMIRDTRTILLEKIHVIVDHLFKMVVEYSSTPMMSRTHGQPASPTTLGKEVAVFLHRVGTIKKKIEELSITGKFNGAVGNYHAHTIAYPNVDWIAHSKKFVQSLGFSFCLYSTQVESHDTMATFFLLFSQLNSVLIDLCRDFWGYISLGYLKQQINHQEVGSSTMPHKVNPINFENAESNLSLANSLLIHLSEQLTVSRWQRDLKDSTLKRNIGVAFGHCLLGYSMLIKGLTNVNADTKKMLEDLNQNWELLAEAVQSVMRRYKINNAYEEMKKLTRGQKITSDKLHKFIKSLPLPPEDMERLIRLTPESYIGYAKIIAQQVINDYAENN
ncbi:adenylosuccinate lyase [Candidatus Ichthyocystis sparus]|nr:adenylosuccinate lyase [Candidatus Ichthyocystis sparus]